jgi:hypothetical protein
LLSREVVHLENAARLPQLNEGHRLGRDGLDGLARISEAGLAAHPAGYFRTGHWMNSWDELLVGLLQETP